MDDSDNRHKVEEYWSHVFSAGNSLFSNPGTHVGTLQPFIDIVLSTKLLPEIECLSNEDASDDYPFPMTGWLLENIFYVVDGDSSQSFLIEAQIKLLEVTYDRNVFDYLVLSRIYIDALEKFLKAKTKINILNNTFRPVLNAVIPPVPYTIKSSSHRLRSFDVLCKIFMGTIDLYFDSCTSNHAIYLITKFKNIIDIGDIEVIKVLLPLLKKACENIEKTTVSEEVFRSILLALSGVFTSEHFNSSDIRREFLDVWQLLKGRISLTPHLAAYIIDRLIVTKTSHTLENYVLKEFGSLLSFLPADQVSTYIQATRLSLLDKISALEPLLFNEMSSYLSRQEEKNYSDLCERLVVKSVSKLWSQMLPSILEAAQPGTAAYGKIKTIRTILALVSRLVGALQTSMEIVKKELIFFDGSNILTNILKCACDHIMSGTPEISLLAADAMASLFNLPEAACLTENDLSDTLNCIMQLMAGASLASSDLKVKILRCLQNVPPGILPSKCLHIFASAASMLSHEREVAIESVRCVPLLCMSGKISCAQSIAEILVPAMLTEQEDMQLEALQSAAKIACVFSGLAFILRDDTGNCEVQCRCCLGRRPGESGKGCEQIESHLLKLIDTVFGASPAVRLKMLTLLPNFSRHLDSGFVESDIGMKLIDLLRDPDVNVRHYLGKVMPTIIFGGGSLKKPTEKCGLLLRYFFKRIEDKINDCNLETWTEEVNCVMDTLVRVACHPCEEVLLPSLRILLGLSYHCPVPMSSITCSIAASHRTSSMILYHTYKSKLSQIIARIIVANYERYNITVASTLSNLSDFFHELSRMRFISGSEPYILPALLAVAAHKTEHLKIITEYADFVGQPLLTIVTKCFQFIYVHIYLTESEGVFDTAMKRIDELTGIKTASLIPHSLKSIIHQLLFHYQTNENKVLNALKKVLDLNSLSCNKELIAANLESRFVGYLLFIVSKFTKDDSCEGDRVQALESLTAVLYLMGVRRVTAVARKVLATLQSALNNEKHCSLQCKAWNAFVRNVNCRVLAPFLSTIVVSLQPMLTEAESDVINVLSYLLVEQRSAMDGYLQNITFLPQLDALKHINSSLSAYTAVQSYDVRERLTRETNLALHETVGVRMKGLDALRSTLQAFPMQITALINECDSPDKSVISLWEALLVCCRDNDNDVAAAAAACLGELGAVDPALMPRKLKPPNKLPLTVHEPEFAFLALREIVRGFQNSRASVDMDAFAIGLQVCPSLFPQHLVDQPTWWSGALLKGQEILKIYEITDDDENTTWFRFTESERSLMRPMFSSRYKVQVAVRSSWPSVIFGSPDASTHLRWASLWAGKLISYCADDKAVVLFRACEPSFKRDARVLQFFLQYIVVHILTQDIPHHNEILTEVNAVLSWSPSDVPKESSLPLRLMEPCGYPIIRSSISEADVRDSAMTIYLIIDFLQYWTRSYLTKYVKTTANHLQNKDYTSVKEFLAKIDLANLASGNFGMKEFPRAIQCWEDLSWDNNSILMEHLPMLTKSYARFGDLDSVVGARALTHSTLDINDQIFYHQVSRQMEEVRILYEQLMTKGKLSPSQIEGLVLCYLALGEPSSASSLIQRFNDQSPEMPAILYDAQAECLLQLGDWRAITDFVKNDDSLYIKGSWHTEILRISESSDTNFTDRIIGEIRSAVSHNFAALGAHATTDNYDYASAVKLHILNDIETLQDFMHSQNDSKPPLNIMFPKKMKEWDAKDSLVQSNSEFYEQILTARRFFLRRMSEKTQEIAPMINEAVGKSWVKSAEIARKAGSLHQAYNYILHAEPYNIPQTFIEKAQLLWDKGQKEESLLTLTRGITTYFPDAETMKSLPPDERLDDRKLMAEAKLLYAVYNEETSNCTTMNNVVNYQETYEVCRQLEKSQVMLAQCLDRTLALMDPDEQSGTRGCDLSVAMLCHFGKSLANGCEYIYQSVPRMLSVWLEIGEKLTTEERIKALKKCNKMIQTFNERLPAYIFMTAFPQLLSRIGHANREVFLILKSIIVKLTLAFPQQCLWAMQTVSKSSVPERSARYKEIISDPALREASTLKLIEDFSLLGDKLNTLTNKTLPQGSIVKGLLVSNVVRELPLLLESDKFSRIIIPITKFCSIALPKNITSTTHQPFMKDPATIVGIKKEMQVLPSLQRPRKITLLGSDGKFYDILCKPQDDLRRDARLMEFNNIVNMYLHRNPDCRTRQLHIRTYAVTPLGECGGLLEWVSNLVGLRPALLELFREHGRFISTKELRSYELSVKESLEKKRRVFLEKLIPMHPPIFREWFRRTFPDPAGWYAARQAYTRTTAVMSMVGYILGLGDRHGENILFDSESGDTVHVDFNCLFNKGEKFDWKERVPFRLTHNMAKAMGPCGVEGTFRKSCEMSMRVLRAQGKTLMSVLTPFAYDPFGSWSKNKEITRFDRERQTAEALQELGDIDKRLKGSMRLNQKNNTFYLSVEGLVRDLIAEATNIDNLCQMYLGWGAYL